jgi:peptidoglycan/LPS O-acetylase OafA/YrhL
MTRTNIRNGQIVGLDLIRFAAAMLVMAHHLAFAIWAKHHFDARYTHLGRYTWSGWIGVEIFFVLSGFIISYSAQQATPSSFVKNRLIRLYPAAWACSTITLGVIYFTGRELPLSPLWQAWLRSFFLSPFAPYVDSVYWTLPVEMVFYTIIFVLLFSGLLRHLEKFMSVVGIISASNWIADFLWGRPTSRPANAILLPFYFFIHNFWTRYLLVDYGCFFTIGALLWVCLFRRPTVYQLFVLFFCCIGAMLEIRSHAQSLSLMFDSHYSDVAALIIWPASLLAIVASVRYNTALGEQLGPRGIALSRQLGLMTYPLYLVHQVVGFICIAFLHRIMPDIAALLITMALMIATSFAICNYFERPIQSALRRLFFGIRTSAPIPTGTLP